MNELQFVNINGFPVSTAAPAKKPAAVRKAVLTRVADEKNASQHWGYEIVGVPREALNLAREEAADKERPFDESLWLNGAKRKRCFSRTFEISESAQQAVEIMKKDARWLRVESRAILKGLK